MDNTPQANNSTLLQVRNLSMRYGKTHALKGINLEIPKGKIVGILGPNGSGKTTLIKTVMGLISDYTGEIRIANHPPGPMANAHIAYLPDRSHIPSWFTTSRAITFFADFYKDFNKTQAHEMLENMKIPLRKNLSALSRGMQEKVQLALVMSRQCDLYVLDEPIGAVDPASREFIVETILKNFPVGGSIL
ncbi:MAG: ABC transporter ATP-binding protein, partial [Defluviitaleaceae bacterium]|nr:ABC transporter ATP-binding protein [Defluviitaleaceae bacterium]